VEVIDTWGMTVTPVDGVFEATAKGYRLTAAGAPAVRLPGKPYLALRVRKAG
jgi:hypothetical protein